LKQKTYPQLKKEADKAQSKYVHLRDAGKGCISCGKKDGRMECGHYISRNHYAVRWNPDNVALQCHYCNRWLQGNSVGFREGLIERIGLDRVETMERLRNVVVKHTRQDLIILIENFKQRIKELEGKN